MYSPLREEELVVAVENSWLKSLMIIDRGIVEVVVVVARTSWLQAQFRRVEGIFSVRCVWMLKSRKVL
jgi:hypothetical protein